MFFDNIIVVWHYLSIMFSQAKCIYKMNGGKRGFWERVGSSAGVHVTNGLDHGDDDAVHDQTQYTRDEYKDTGPFEISGGQCRVP